jgi:predicted DNA-binding transcriptional regulator AlpA
MSEELDEDLRMLRLERVLELIPVSKVHIYRMIKAKEFPAPVKVGHVSLWSNEEIREWKKRRLAAPRMLVNELLERKRRREVDDLA